MRLLAGLAAVALLLGAAWWLLREEPVDVRRGAQVPAAVSVASAPAVLPEARTPESEEVRPTGAPETPSAAVQVLHGLATRLADGSGLPGAAVYWLTDDGHFDESSPSAVTDHDGRFAAEWPVGATRREMLVRWRPTVVLLDEGPEKQMQALPRTCEGRFEISARATDGPEQAYALDTGWTIAGEMLDGPGHPLYGARIIATPGFALGESDRGGRYRLQDLDHLLDSVVVSAGAPGRVGRTLTVSRPESGATVLAGTIVLPEAGVVMGKIIDPTGAFATGTRVDVLLRGQPGAAAEVRSSVVGEMGRFEIGDLPSGFSDVLVRPDAEVMPWLGERSARAVWVRNVHVRDDRAAYVEVMLPEGVEVSGRVTDSSGVPLREHIVRMVDAFDSRLPDGPDAAEARAVTGPDGEFTLRSVLPGNKTVVVLSSKFIDRNIEQALLQLSRPPSLELRSSD